MIAKTAAAESLDREATRNVLEEIDLILAEIDKKQGAPPPVPVHSKPPTRTMAKKK